MSRVGRILLTGAAGKTGRAVLRHLFEHREPPRVRALVRNLHQAAALEAMGISDLVEGDLQNADSVARALEGVTAIYHICPNVHPNEIEIGRAVIELAREAGATRFVFHSVLHPQTEAMPHHWAKLRVEERLLESGLDFTILQPAPYMQNLFAQWTQIEEDGVYCVPYAAATRVVLVDLEDVAEAAAKVLTEPGHAGATYELCGPDAPNQTDIVRTLARHLDRDVRLEVQERSRWRMKAEAAGLGGYRIGTLLMMFRYYERFGLAGNSRVLSQLLGREPTSFSMFVERTVAG